jgi:hypothetical protein
MHRMIDGVPWQTATGLLDFWRSQSTSSVVVLLCERTLETAKRHGLITRNEDGSWQYTTKGEEWCRKNSLRALR